MGKVLRYQIWIDVNPELLDSWRRVYSNTEYEYEEGWKYELAKAIRRAVEMVLNLYARQYDIPFLKDVNVKILTQKNDLESGGDENEKRV